MYVYGMYVCVYCLAYESVEEEVETNNPCSSFVCPSSALPVPTIDGEARCYVGPDGSITLTCRFSSLHLLGTTWLLNGEDVSSTLGEGNSISGDPNTSTLTFTQFNAAIHSGAYQCQVQGLLGDLVSRTVDVLPAGEW